MSFSEPTYRLILFVAGDNPLSRRAREDVEALCNHLQGRCRLEVVDILHEYATTRHYTIFATPTLLLVGPPERRVIGDFSNKAAMLRALELPSET